MHGNLFGVLCEASAGYIVTFAGHPGGSCFALAVGVETSAQEGGLRTKMDSKSQNMDKLLPRFKAIKIVVPSNIAKKVGSVGWKILNFFV